MRIFNNPDLYPTPIEVIEQMTVGMDLKGKNVLEPSAGMGDIVDFCAGSGASVLACEIVPELRDLLNQKECRLIGEDFLSLSSTEISHIDYIIMNPPFSADEKHITHAWEIAPEGCEIVALCNYETLRNDYNRGRKILGRLVQDYGTSENLGNVFQEAERETNINIGLIRLFKPKTNGDNDFSEYFSDEADDEEEQFNGLMRHSHVREIVQRYVSAVKQYDVIIEKSVELNKTISAVASYGFKDLTVSVSRESAKVTKENFVKELKKSSWKYIFAKLDMGKFVTVKVKEDLNVLIEKQTSIPFTMKNIWLATSALRQNVTRYMDQSLLQVFDNLTKYYDENRYGVEGWKTNSHYLINKKFIHPRVVGISYGGNIEIPFGRTADEFDDLLKALCFITGENFDSKMVLRERVSQSYYLKYPDGKYLTSGQYKSLEGRSFSEQYDHQRKYFREEKELNEFCTKHSSYRFEIEYPIQWGQWFDWEFFEVKLYKKGTGHFKFKDEKVWELFNYNVARIKGFPLPEAV